MSSTSQDFKHNVFINCPFDAEYRPVFDAIVFTIQLTGFRPRSALEASNAATNRLQKIMTIIGQCKYGIHDLSRTELNSRGLPRFNMPLELGMFLGAKRFGSPKHKLKTCLILDVERYRYQKFISDIAGQDIAAHDGNAEEAIKAVRNRLSAATSKSVKIPSGSVIARRYAMFRSELPATCERLQLNVDELTFADYVLQVEEWLKINAQTAS